PEIMVNQNGSIKINATDETELDRVELYLGETKLELNEDNSYTYTPTEAGEFTFTAKAYDKAGNASTSTFKINVKKYASEQEEFEENLTEYLMICSEIVELCEKIGISYEQLEILNEEARRRENGGEPLTYNEMVSKAKVDSINEEQYYVAPEWTLLQPRTKLMTCSMPSKSSSKNSGNKDKEITDEERRDMSSKVSHCATVAKYRGYDSSYAFYLYMSHFIDIPNEPITCDGQYLPHIITQYDIAAYEKFVSVVNVSEFVDNFANVAADIYTLKNTDFSKKTEKAKGILDAIKNASAWFDAYCAEDAIEDSVKRTIGNAIDNMIKTGFYRYARSTEDIVKELENSYNNNINLGKTGALIVGTAVFGLITGGAILMPTSVLIGTAYVDFYTDLMQVAALVALRYSLSTRVAERLWIAQENGEI
ncbi:MAG: hypothetical protein MSA89_13525, partial [Clostridium sp.]|nr:hypothetical protein [Clostridium sp.]